MYSVLLKNAIVILLLLLSCAHQVPPTGGPLDETPPAVASITPEQGTTEFPLNGRISFTFGEWVDPNSARKSISVFPPPSDGLKIRVRGRTIHVIPQGPLADSTTYHVEVNSTLEDLHGNAIRSPLSLVFSTGTALDSGSLSGCVIDPQRLLVQPKVALFRAVDSVVPESTYFSLPDYLTQTDSLGRFSLQYVRTGLYDVFAFVDEIPDSRFRPGEGAAYAAQQLRIAVGPTDTSIQLFPVEADTNPPVLQTPRAHSQNFIRGSWADPIPQTESVYWQRWRLEEFDEPDSVISIAGYETLGTSSFILRVAGPLRSTAYRLIYQVSDPRRAFGRDSVAVDSIRFNGLGAQDTVSPEFIAGGPSRQVSLRTGMWAVFSEPIRLRRALWPLVDTLTNDTVLVSGDTSFTDTVNFSADQLLQPGTTYRLNVPWESFVDLGGNMPFSETDTNGLEVMFSTYPYDELCASLSGSGECLENDPGRLWMFSWVGGRSIATEGSDGSFRFDSLEAGNGQLSMLYDYNDDGRFTQGSLFPFYAPEPYFSFPDTIEARARWDISGVEVSACKPCEIAK